jgi:hypothetical protein
MKNHQKRQIIEIMNLLLRWAFDNDLLNHIVLEKLFLVQDLDSYPVLVSLTNLTLVNVASRMVWHSLYFPTRLFT